MAVDVFERARGGDESAFADLVGPMRDELTAYCYRMLGSFHEAEDVVQESLTRAWRTLTRLDGPGSLRPWLYKIATNRCLTHLGKATRHRELPTDLTPGEADAAEALWLEPYPDHRMTYSDELDPEARAVAWESIQLAFVSAIQRIPARQRAVLLLRDVLGYSGAETAAMLKTSVAGVNSALQRARAARPARQPSAQPPRDNAAVRDLARRYAAAWEAGDVDSIVGMLADDARYSMPPIPQVFVGPASIRNFLVEGPLTSAWRFVPTYANGSVAFGTYIWDADASVYVPCGLDVVVLRDDAIVEVVSFLEARFPDYDLPDRLRPGDEFRGSLGL